MRFALLLVMVDVTTQVSQLLDSLVLDLLVQLWNVLLRWRELEVGGVVVGGEGTP
jgi:hypothetical protein